MHFVVEQFIDAQPEVVFAFLTNPDLMNQWSTAKIIGVDPASNNSFASVGSLRQIRIRNRIILDEVIRFSEPAKRLVYCVYNNTATRNHQGTITLTPNSKGTSVRWDVRATIVLPGIDGLASTTIQRDLQRSLRALASVAVATINPAKTPAIPNRKTTSTCETLFEDAQTTLARQRDLAATLLAQNNPLGWFARVYEYVTEAQIDGCRKQQVDNPDWVLRLIPVFDDYYYRQNLAPQLAGDTWQVGRHWRKSFKTSLNVRGQFSEFTAFFLGLKYAIRAHIEEDLPRALAEVHLRHFSSVPFKYFRADYVRMAQLFSDAAKRATADIPRQNLPTAFRQIQKTMPDVIADEYIRRQFYDVGRARMVAFERGARISEAMANVIAAKKTK